MRTTDSRFAGHGEAVRRGTLALGVLMACWVTPGSAQELKVFFCYAPNVATGTVYVSSMHPVGPVAERAQYGSEFAAFLVSQGKLPVGAQAYCVMRATAGEVLRGQATVTELCSECGQASTVVPTEWVRDGRRGAGFRLDPAGKIVSPDAPGKMAASSPSGAGPRQTDPSTGVYLMGRVDATGVVYSVNRRNGEAAAAEMAKEKGGEWELILRNDRCVGWVAVAFVTNGAERQYIVAHGEDDESSARRAATEAADALAQQKGGGWISGPLAAFRNEYQRPAADFSGGLIEGTKGEVRKVLQGLCAEAKARPPIPIVRFVGGGVRG